MEFIRTDSQLLPTFTVLSQIFLKRNTYLFLFKKKLQAFIAKKICN